MADEEQVKILRSDVEAWNAWRTDTENKCISSDLYEADLRGADLRGADLAGALLLSAKVSGADLGYANLGGADLRGADLWDANLGEANLSEANLSGAYLGEANLERASLIGANLIGFKFTSEFDGPMLSANFGGANLSGANLSEANLERASLMGADLTRALLDRTDFTEAKLGDTTFADVDLTKAEGLDRCYHGIRSTVDYRTLQRSKNVPISFWRGCGLPDRLIEYMPSIFEDAIQFYSCFISYSSKDQEFADRLHADLQNAGVRCWFAPHDLPIGAKTWDGIDEAIRTRDKVLLILSEGAIASDWVEDEVTTAFAEERRRDELVLFPVRLDNSVMETCEAWAGKLRDNRNIGDFTRWKDHDAYKKTFDRILRDLKAKG